jgi:acetamidase/formamidase
VARGLKPRPQAVHIGHFSTALRPLLMINPGDIVTIETATRPSNSVSSARASCGHRETQEMRKLLRTRKQLAREKSSKVLRVQKTLEDANIKLKSRDP